jgi:hypothetical protein
MQMGPSESQCGAAAASLHPHGPENVVGGDVDSEAIFADTRSLDMAGAVIMS